jgi:hypothetical protein
VNKNYSEISQVRSIVVLAGCCFFSNHFLRLVRFCSPSRFESTTFHVNQIAHAWRTLVRSSAFPVISVSFFSLMGCCRKKYERPGSRSVMPISLDPFYTKPTDPLVTQVLEPDAADSYDPSALVAKHLACDPPKKDPPTPAAAVDESPSSQEVSPLIPAVAMPVLSSKVKFTQDDVARLWPGEFLNDNIIEYSLEYVRLVCRFNAFPEPCVDCL